MPIGPAGHGWFINDDPEIDPPLTLHRLKGSYVASVFDVVHDNGGSTALYADKSKFAIYDRSWNADNGAEDSLGTDSGKVPFYVWGPGAGLAAGDLYHFNWIARFNPGPRLPFRLHCFPPIRNGDAANLALDLLGLPPVPQSVINAGQYLRVVAPPPAR